MKEAVADKKDSVIKVTNFNEKKREEINSIHKSGLPI
jgi:hypothetical protein